MPAHSRHLHVAANFIKAATTLHGLDEDSIEAVEISVMEAVENVIDHAQVGGNDSVTLTVWQEGDDFVVEVGDRGVPWPPEVLSGKIGREMPPPESPRGRGLAMMCALMDAVIPGNGDGGKTLKLVKRLTRIEAG